MRSNWFVTVLMATLSLASTALVTTAGAALDAPTLTVPNPLDPYKEVPSAGCPPDKGCEQGYWLVADDGTVTSHGTRRAPGRGPTATASDPVVAMASTVQSDGYWIVTASGKVTAVGAARHHRDLTGSPPQHPIVGIAARSDGGYWLAATDGAVYAFGDATYAGRADNPTQPITGIAAAGYTNGYWLTTTDGTVYAYGDARTLDRRSERAPAPQPIVAIAPSGYYADGYWLLSQDGTVTPYGDAPLYPGPAGKLKAPATGMTRTNGGGIWVASSDGHVYGTGVAEDHGSAPDRRPDHPLVAIVL